MVVVDAEPFPLAFEFRGHLQGVFFGAEISGLRGALDVAAVFIGAGGEDDRIEALHLLIALHQVGNERGIGGTNVRRRVDVVDRCGQVVFHRMVFRYARFASARISLSGTPVSRAILRQSSYSGANDPLSAILIRTFPC